MGEYVPTPVDFISNPNMCDFGVKESKIIDNLDFIIEKLENDTKINLPWGESFYMEDLKPAYNELIGVRTLKALIRLDKYNKVEK